MAVRLNNKKFNSENYHVLVQIEHQIIMSMEHTKRTSICHSTNMKLLWESAMPYTLIPKYRCDKTVVCLIVKFILHIVHVA